MKHAGVKPAIGSLLLLLAWVIFPRPNPAAELKIAARGAVLMNAQTGKIIRAHNQDLRAAAGKHRQSPHGIGRARSEPHQ